jgi:hypothetical protein
MNKRWHQEIPKDHDSRRYYKGKNQARNDKTSRHPEARFAIICIVHHIRGDQ